MPLPGEHTANLASRTPSTAVIDRITAMDNPVLRNLEITQCYYLLSEVFATRISDGANWCTYATWASKQAGQTIRKEDLQQSLIAFLQKQPELEEAVSLLAALAKKTGIERDIEPLRQIIFAALVEPAANRASDAVSRGNKKVFEEIAREFARFIEACFRDETFDAAQVTGFTEKLTKGGPPDGQDLLKLAFEKYYQLLFKTDDPENAELLLYANLLIGFHEQTRLQPEIAESLNSAVDRQWARQKLETELLARLSWWQRLLQFLNRIIGKTNLLDKAIDALASKAEFHLRRFMTAHLMTLTLPPGNCLQLGHDLTAGFPLNLQQLKNKDLLSLLQRIDPTPDSLAQSGATDWADLNERMHYIADMFRCFQQDEHLFDEAFSQAQLDQLQAGQLPEGPL